MGSAVGVTLPSVFECAHANAKMSARISGGNTSLVGVCSIWKKRGFGELMVLVEVETIASGLSRVSLHTAVPRGLAGPMHCESVALLCCIFSFAKTI